LRELELDAAQNGRHHDLHLIEREGHAETAPDSAAERKPRVWIGPRAEEPLRPKLFRIRVDIGPLVREVDVRRHNRAWRNLESAE
jgi:hypothetical protein